jgi:hypothetical protein
MVTKRLPRRHVPDEITFSGGSPAFEVREEIVKGNFRGENSGSWCPSDDW